MKSKIFKGIFIIASILLFVLLCKYYYFDTNIGFSKEILELNYSAFPTWFDVLISIIFMPLLLFAILEDIYERICDRIDEKHNIATN